MRNSKVRAMDALWELTQPIHAIGWPEQTKRQENISQVVGELYEQGLTIKQIELLTVLILDVYEQGKES